ncbi:MAG TPA: proton-conducting transporter membrane subunit, partial [Solirubrobacteraceae bacterium]|nr:proton-conducting transporter membrane subunit [Solirubrobacteraceae bacterium]
AATMVTAGVYLIARMHVLFELAPAAQDVGAVIGALTLLIAGTIALVQTDIKRVIAYSTMSQIGYMIMGVSVGAYAAGMFHLMTHAFFKALLFMGAGSIIGAMAGAQSLERMGGFRRVLPFTFACFVIGGLALSGIPPFSGFFSKDEILLVTGERGGWHWILYVMGYLGAFLTAIYTFRMIFRAFYGDPVPEARELEGGHLHHAEVPTNPADGEVEDTDVGFPGPHHTIAERALPMKVAMTVLAIGAAGAGLVQVPGVDDVIVNFLRPTFAQSPLYEPHTRDGLLIFGLCLGTVLGLSGIAIAYRIWVREPAIATRARERFAAIYELLAHKWYFDELIDALVVRPAAAAGRFATTTFERVFVQDTLVGGASGVVRAGSAAVRAVQSGFLRYYAAMLVLGLTAVGLYFLLQS